jgi:hypothetical protein
MTTGPSGLAPLKMGKSGQGARAESEPGTDGWQGARLRAAVDRLHAAQLAALAAREAPAAPAASVLAPPAPPEEEPAARRDAVGAQHEVLAQVDEMGSLLGRLGRLGRADGEAAAVRRRLVKLSVAAANTLAELVGLAFEIESPVALAEAGAGERAEGEKGPPGTLIAGLQ